MSEYVSGVDDLVGERASSHTTCILCSELAVIIMMRMRMRYHKHGEDQSALSKL